MNMTIISSNWYLPHYRARFARLANWLSLAFTMGLTSTNAMADTTNIKLQRLAANPLLTTASSPVLGNNVNGPSVIRVPDWIKAPLGKYYMYFAHHKGKNIRLAYANEITGPWTVHEPGTLQLEDSFFPTGVIPLDGLPEAIQKRVSEARAEGDDPLYTHIASPDVVVVPEREEIRLYYHGMQSSGAQASRVAVSSDGITFRAREEVIARPYLRVFNWDNQVYGMAMPGVFYRSPDGLTGFEEGPSLFNRDMRHAALVIRGQTLYVFWTQVGDAPEQILLSTIDLSGDWHTWQASPPIPVLKPEHDWEGANLPVVPSVRGAIEVPVNQLRDPAIFEENGRTWLFYSIQGESGIGIAEVKGL
ncbi:MAG: hypothetical protein ACFHX7_05040 [Pseudomonadota bacterium]